MAVYFVSGASRGIGFELVKQLLARGDVVVAGVRNPGTTTNLRYLKQKNAKLHIVELDVSKPDTIKAAAAALECICPSGVDVLINVAGVLGSSARASEASAADIEFVHRVNVVGPLVVTQAMLPLIKKGQKKVVANVSSTLGSIGDKVQYMKNDEARRSYLFASKFVEVHHEQETMSLAADLKDEGITVIAYCPGWVKTDMGNSGAEHFDGTVGPDLTPEDSVKAQLKVIDGADLSKTGGFFAHTGEPLPW